LLALPAVADEPSSDAPDASALFTQLDTNKDGQLATDEIPDDRRSLFDRLVRIGDQNNDGKLNAEEFAAGLAGGRQKALSPKAPSGSERSNPEGRDGRPGPARLFERLDANGDGKVALDEVPEPGRERFQQLLARADKDGDGAVTRREFAAAAPLGDPKKPGAKGKRPEADRDGSQLFKRLDRNADEKLTADELPEERRQMLERLIERGDKNGDESLSREEFTAVFGKRRPGGKPGDADAKRKNNAAPDRPMPPGLFGAIDADHDGELTSTEIAAAADAIRKLDRDGDGTVTAREVLAGAARSTKQKDQ